MGHKHLVLQELLENSGWTIEHRETENLEWWADEIWRIRSTWRPTDLTLHLTFEVDPQHSGNRRKDEAVWALSVSKEMPSREQPEQLPPYLNLNTHFERGLGQFIADLGKLRDDA